MQSINRFQAQQHHEALFKTHHEQLRRDIERQVTEFLASGGEIEQLSSPNYRPNRHVQARGSLLVDQ